MVKNMKYTKAKLPDICTIKTGKHDANHANKEGKYRFYTCSNQYSMCDTYSFTGESVIVPGNGDIGLVFYYDGEFDAYQRTYVLSDIKILPKYLFYHLQLYWRNFNDQKKFGSTVKYVRMSNFTNYGISYPSIEEQQRIVAKIEELFSDLDNAVETLNATKVQLEVYKQTVLYEAFSNLSDTVDMQEIATMIDPQPSHRTPPEVVGGIPYIGIGDIDYDNNIIKFDSARKVSASVLAEHLSRYTISKGDFVMGKIGTIGKPYRIPIPQEYALSANVILIQPNHELILPDFLYWQFSSHHVTSQLLKGANATSQPAFGIKKSRLLKIKMCDFEQQRAINLDIESKISVYESIAHTVEKSLEEASAMRQSILKQAFEGRLL